MFYRRFARLWIALVAFTLVQHESAHAADDWKEPLSKVAWRNPGIRRSESLTLHADGTCTLVSIRQHARMAKGEEPPQRFNFVTAKKTRKGKWQILSTSQQIVKLELPSQYNVEDEPDRVEIEGVRLAMLEGEAKSKHRFQYVTLIERRDMDMMRSDHLLVANRCSVVHEDLARWPNERDLSGFLGPATGINVSKRSIVSDPMLHKINSAVPKGWAAIRVGNAVVVSRGEKVETDSTPPSSPGYDSAAAAWNDQNEVRFSIVVHFEHRLKPSDRKQLREETNRKIAALLPSMEHFKDPPGVKPSGWGYRPETAEDERMLEQYRGFKRTIEELPDFYNDSFSATIEDSLGYYEWIPEDATRGECNKVLKSIENQFSRYEPAPDETGFIDVPPATGIFISAPFVAEDEPHDADKLDDKETAAIRHKLEDLKAKVIMNESGHITEVHWDGNFNRGAKVIVEKVDLSLLRPLKSLRVLRLQSAPVGDDDLKHLSGLTELTHLSLYKTNVTDAGFANLNDLTKLKSLSVVATDVGDPSMEMINRNKDLEVLHLSFSKVTNKGLKKITKLSKLKTLYLNGTAVTDDGLESVRRLNNLQTLYIHGMDITDEGLKHLPMLQQLRLIKLANTRVTQEGAAVLQRAIPDATIDLTKP